MADVFLTIDSSSDEEDIRCVHNEGQIWKINYLEFWRSSTYIESYTSVVSVGFFFGTLPLVGY